MAQTKEELIKELRKDKAYRKKVAKYLLEDEFMMYSLYKGYRERKVTESNLRGKPYYMKNGYWHSPKLYKNRTSFMIKLPHFELWLSHKEFNDILKELQATHDYKVENRTKVDYREHVCDKCGNMKVIDTNHYNYTEKCKKCYIGTLICTKRPKVTKFEREMEELRKFLPESKEVQSGNVLELKKTAMYEGEECLLKGLVRWNNEYGNAYGNTFHITGDVTDSNGEYITSGSIGHILEKHFTELEDMDKYHGFNAYSYSFANNIIFCIASRANGIESALRDINYKDGEVITMENLLDKKWLYYRLRDVVIPEFKEKIEKLGFIY